MRLLILGGNRFIGAELVRQAIDQGHDVTVLSIDKPSNSAASWLKANRNAPLSGLFAHLSYDSVIDNIAFRAGHVTSLVDALRDKVTRYVLTSSVDIYRNQEAKYCDERRDERLKPTLHQHGIPRWESYLRGKRACEIALRRSPHFETVVVRPAVVMGCGDNIMWPRGGSTSRSEFFALRIADGGPILLRHTDTRLHQVAYVGDVARAMLLAATHGRAAGQLLNVVGDDVWTNERLVCALARSVGRRPDILRVSDAQLETADLADYETPYSRSNVHAWSLFSNQRLKGLGWNPTPIEEWGPTLFCANTHKKRIRRRQNEVSLGRKLSKKTFAGMAVSLEGRFQKPIHAISSVGIGTHRGSDSVYEDRRYFAAIKRAVRGGINIIDTAINYRCMRSEQTVGRAIESLLIEGTARSSLCVVTKGGIVPRGLRSCGVLTDAEVRRKHSITAQYIAVSLQHSIRNTRLESIDVYLLHNPERSLEHLGQDRFYETLIETFAMLEQRTREGVIGLYGIATWHGFRMPAGHKWHIDLERVLRCSEMAAGGNSHFRVIELPFNPRAREAATVHSQKLDGRLVSALDLAAGRGLLVLTSRSVMAGAGDSTESLRFVRSHPQVSCALVGMRQPEHVDQALAIMRLDRVTASQDRKQRSTTGRGAAAPHSDPRSTCSGNHNAVRDRGSDLGDDDPLRLVQFARDGAFSLSTAALILAAERRGIPWARLNRRNLVQLGNGRNQKHIDGTITSETSARAMRLAADKLATNRLLGASGLPVPNQVLIPNVEEAVGCAARIGYPVVVKPADSCEGRGVSVDLTTPEEVQIAFDRAREVSRRVLIEAHIRGCDHRMLVVNNELVAVAKRIPAHVVGDGARTIVELIEQANEDPRRGPGHENVLTLLQLDQEAERVLAKYRYRPETIPPRGEKVYLSGAANLSSGGIAIDATADVHQDHREMAVRSIRLIGLDVGGVDFITSDISRPYRETGGAICEVNASPGLRMHLVPSAGPRRDVAGAIIDMLFPSSSW